MSSGATLGFIVGVTLILVSVIWLLFEARDKQFMETNQVKKNQRVKWAATMALVGIIIILVLGFMLFIL